LDPPPAAFFFEDIALKNHPLQCHDTFRLLERDVPIAFVDFNLVHGPEFKGAKVKFWSDGRRGLIKVLEKKEFVY
jgi:hypothetical protein